MLKNTRVYLNSLFLICSFWSCKSPAEQAPIGKEKMSSILLDVHFAEAYSSLLKSDSLQKKSSNKNIDSLAVFYRQILDKYQVSTGLFDSAIKWYSLHPAELDSVYAVILPKLDSLKTIPLTEKH